MRRIRTTITSLAVLVLAACAAVRTPHEPSPSPSTASGSAAVTAAEDVLYAALAARDTVTLARSLGAEFVLSGSAAALETRQQYLETAMMPNRTLRPLELSDRAVRIYGGTAVTTGRGTISGALGERAFSMDFRYTNVFVQRDGRWQAVASHLSTIR